MTIKASWIGLGVMGFPDGGPSLGKYRFEVTVYNRSAGKGG